jgi:predicted histidine transporter YuiF (NhaC family)
MNQYQKIAFVVIRASGYLGILGAVREFVEVIIYVACMQLKLLPYFYFNVGWAIFVGIIYLASCFLIIAISRPLAIRIGGYFDSELSDK